MKINVYQIRINGVVTHAVLGKELPALVSQFNPVHSSPARSLLGEVLEVCIKNVSEKAKARFGDRCPAVGQRFTSLARAAAFMGTPVTGLYQSHLAARKGRGGTYGVWGVEMEYVAKEK